MAKLDKVIRADEVKVELKKFRSWFDVPFQTPQDKLAKAVIKQCIEIIDKLKPVEAEPIKHAHWMFYMDESGEWWDKCSGCGGKIRNEGGYCCDLPRCPNCGAHMDEEVAG